MTPELSVSPEVPTHYEVNEIHQIPEKHRESLVRIQEIAGIVGSEIAVISVNSPDEIKAAPGVYLMSNVIDAQMHTRAIGSMFALDTKLLSGKIDSGHAVLPGMLSMLYRNKAGKMEERHYSIAAKGHFSREYADRLERVKTEIIVSQMQAEHGELAFEPLAVVVASPEYLGKATKKTEFDLLLVTKLDEGVKTLDNAPWQLGFNEANLDAAEKSINALARFNTKIGMHGDAKIKNIAQRADGSTSMIDFETSEILDLHNPANAAMAVHEDVGTFLDSLVKRGFFTQEAHRANEVMEHLGEIYLDHWADFPVEVQDAVYREITTAIEDCIQTSSRNSHSHA